MSEDLGVGRRMEPVSGLNQPFLDPVEIFDHAIMDDGDSAALIEVRVGVLVGRRSVGSPAGVSDSQVAGGGPGVQKLAEAFIDFAFFFARLEFGAVEHAEPGAIVAAVFEPAQPLQKNGSCLLPADIAYDAAHGLPLALALALERWGRV